MTARDDMEEVLGLGGFAISARDPEGLGRWYRETLGLRMCPGPDGALVWVPAGVPERQALASFARIPQPGGGKVALTLRVRALDAMVRQIERSGIAVSVDDDGYPHGFFARFVDPEGNPVALWEAVVGDAHD
ncbi:MAG: VOC family protein [Paracoccaceae bacterium]